MNMQIAPLAARHVKVTLAGRLDTPGADSIETRFLASLIPDANNAIIDMSQVDFISSMGIRMLVSAARSLKMRQAVLAIYGVQDQVNQVLEVVAIHQIIPVCRTEAEAQAAVGLHVARLSLHVAHGEPTAAADISRNDRGARRSRVAAAQLSRWGRTCRRTPLPDRAGL